MKRIWEIDFARGIAVIMMIIYHLLWSLRYFNILQFKDNLWILIFARSIPTIFFLIVGISLVLSYNKGRKLNYYFKRGIKVISLGLIVSFLAWFLFSENAILGVLTFIGISIILGSFFVNFKKLNLILGFLFIILGLIFSKIKVNFNEFIWIGLTPNNFYPIDYFPLFPWFGIILIGIALGNFLYASGKSLFKEPKQNFVKIINFMGRHALIFYFIHNIIIFGILILVRGK